MALRLNGSNTGYVELDVPADAGSHTLTLPDGGGTAHQVLKNSATAGTLEYGLALPTGNGTSGQYLQTDGAGGSSWVTVTDTTGWTWDTTGTTMTGTTLNFAIPSAATIIKFAFKNYSQITAGGNLRIRLRTSSGTQTSTYESVDAYYGGGESANTRADGWYMNIGATSGTFDGEGEFVYTGSNSWWGETVNKRTIASAGYHFRSIGIADINDTVTGISFDQLAGSMGGGTIFVHYFEP